MLTKKRFFYTNYAKTLLLLLFISLPLIGLTKSEAAEHTATEPEVNISQKNTSDLYLQMGKELFLKGKFSEGLIWLEKSMELGNLNAKILVGRIYILQGGATKEKEALQLLQESADQGCAFAYYALA